MTERGDRRRRRGSGAGRSRQQAAGPRPRRQPPGERQDERGAPERPRSHTMVLEVGGRGMELHCDTCELVVTHLAAPQVRRAVQEAHRRHLASLSWESAWVAVCSCGWRTGRLNQQLARQQLAAHEASVIRPAAEGKAPPPS